MTYEERRKFFCEQCQYKTGCACLNRGIGYKCVPLNEKMEDWEHGYNDAVEAAIEFIYQRQSVDIEVPYIEKFIEEFKKYMMEEQQ